MAWRVWWRPPSTPPYLFLLFYVSTLVFSVASVVYAVIAKDVVFGDLVPSCIDIAVEMSVIYVTGTFPIKCVMPGPSVSSSAEVGLLVRWLCQY